MSELKAVLEGEKIQQIREAALEAFLLFGFKRTSMEDIAMRAGMSRAALYLHFKNKGEIYRSVVAGLYEHATRRFEAALDPKAPVATTVVAALEAKDGGLMAKVLASPHCEEMVSVSEDEASDLVAEGEGKLVRALCDYFVAVVNDRGAKAATEPEILAKYVVGIYGSFYSKPEDGHRMGLLGRTASALLGAD